MNDLFCSEVVYFICYVEDGSCNAYHRRYMQSESCDNDKCYLESDECDGFNDCLDNTDEEGNDCKPGMLISST